MKTLKCCYNLQLPNVVLHLMYYFFLIIFFFWVDNVEITLYIIMSGRGIKVIVEVQESTDLWLKMSWSNCQSLWIILSVLWFSHMDPLLPFLLSSRVFCKIASMSFSVVS